MVSSNSSWRVIGASVRGTGHIRSGRGCDDAHAIRLQDGGLLFLAVADGAGSAAYSATGASTAVRVALDTAELLLNGQQQPAQEDQWLSVLRMILQSAHEAVHQLVLDEIVPTQDIPQERLQQYQLDGKRTLRDFATTLLVAIVTPDWIATVQVGDGAIVLQQVDGSFTSLTPHSRNEYVNETDFITRADYLSAADFTVLSRGGMRGIGLLTDGLQIVAMKMPQNTPSEPFFTPLFRTIAQSTVTEDALRRFLESERICTRTDDDKTLILAVSL